MTYATREIYPTGLGFGKTLIKRAVEARKKAQEAAAAAGATEEEIADIGVVHYAAQPWATGGSYPPVASNLNRGGVPGPQDTVCLIGDYSSTGLALNQYRTKNAINAGKNPFTVPLTNEHTHLKKLLKALNNGTDVPNDVVVIVGKSFPANFACINKSGFGPGWEDERWRWTTTALPGLSPLRDDIHYQWGGFKGDGFPWEILIPIAIPLAGLVAFAAGPAIIAAIGTTAGGAGGVATAAGGIAIKKLAPKAPPRAAPEEPRTQAGDINGMIPQVPSIPTMEDRLEGMFGVDLPGPWLVAGGLVVLGLLFRK